MDTETLSLSTSYSSKRLFDILFSTLALIAFFPLMVVIALLIKFSSKGGTIFAQERLGLHGKVFRCYKFRTMIEDAETKLDQILKQNSQLKKEWKVHQKLKRDPRIVPLGKFFRRYSLDELPQFWNVLMGDMSLVGPRPYAVEQKSSMGRDAYNILSIRPGITGLWQTSGRSSTSFAERLALDLKYLETRSFLFDLFLILKTIPSLILAKDAY